MAIVGPMLSCVYGVTVDVLFSLHVASYVYSHCVEG